MTCPVLSSCYKRLQHYYFPMAGVAGATERFLRPSTETFVEYDNLLPTWEELDEAIHRDAPSSSTQRLRAFFALEVVYYELIPSSPRPVDKVDLSGPLKVQRPRTHAGVQELRDTCALLKRDLVMRRGHTELLGKQSNPAFELMAASLRSATARVELCAAMAEELHRALDDKRRRKELEKVGNLFGEALISFKTPAYTAIEHLRTMLQISLDNPVSPWNQSTNFQV